ncbi:hypothetical protein PInf_017355 [Phytophthora infestans]|nr:hypothetical protein PInf_017355 [Phytophthora infestans]
MRRQYWDLSDEVVGSERKRKKGSGPKRKLEPYEDRVLDYFDNLRADDRGMFGEMLFYCRNIDEFITDFPNLSTQKTWVGRFIARYATPGILNLARETVSNETDSTSNAAAGTTQPSRLLPSTVDSLGLCNIPGQSSTSTCDPDRPLESNQEFDGAVNEMVEVDEDAHGPNMLTDQEVATEGADTIEVGAAKSPSLALLNSSFSTALTYQTATLCEKFEAVRTKGYSFAA